MLLEGEDGYKGGVRVILARFEVELEECFKEHQRGLNVEYGVGE